MNWLNSFEFIPGVKWFETEMHDSLFQHSVFGAIVFLIVSHTDVYKFVGQLIQVKDKNVLMLVHAVVFAVIMYFGSMYLFAPLLVEGGDWRVDVGWSQEEGCGVNQSCIDELMACGGSREGDYCSINQAAAERTEDPCPLLDPSCEGADPHGDSLCDQGVEGVPYCVCGAPDKEADGSKRCAPPPPPGPPMKFMVVDSENWLRFPNEPWLHYMNPAYADRLSAHDQALRAATLEDRAKAAKAAKAVKAAKAAKAVKAAKAAKAEEDKKK